MRLTRTILCLIAALTLTACGGGEATKSQVPESPAPAAEAPLATARHGEGEHSVAPPPEGTEDNVQKLEEDAAEEAERDFRRADCEAHATEAHPDCDPPMK